MFDLNLIWNNMGGQYGGADDAYRLDRTTVKENKFFNVKKTTYTYSLNNNVVRASLFDAEQNFNNFIANFSSEHISPLADDVKIQILIDHTSFDVPINTNFIQKSQFTPQILTALFHNVVQSRKKLNRMQISDSDSMKIILSVAQVMHGAGRVCKRTAAEIDEMILVNQKVTYKKAKILREYCQSTPCIQSIEDDNYCLVRACLLGRIFHQCLSDYKRFSSPGYEPFTSQVLAFAKQLNLPDHPYGLEYTHVEKIEAYIKYQLVIFENTSKVPCYWNKNMNEYKKIYILYNSNEHHFSHIKFIRAYFGSYFCESCMVPYLRVNSHKCPATCQACFRMNCTVETTSKCKCNIMVNSDSCARYHELVCNVLRKCHTCSTTMSARRKHVCINQKYCSNCDAVVELEHMCFIKKVPEKSNVKFKGLGFFDFEAYENENGIHQVNLAMAKRVCLTCYEGKSSCICRPCSEKYKFDNIQDFVAFLKAPANAHFIWYAHNAKGYDSQFILNELHTQHKIKDPKIKVITNGTKILEIRYKSITIRDSACFIPMPLAQFSKAFNITELKKGTCFINFGILIQYLITFLYQATSHTCSTSPRTGIMKVRSPQRIIINQNSCQKKKRWILNNFIAFMSIVVPCLILNVNLRTIVIVMYYFFRRVV